MIASVYGYLKFSFVLSHFTGVFAHRCTVVDMKYRQVLVCTLYQWSLRPLFPLMLYDDILLQLLSKHIGISGHFHRLVAGSMAGKLPFLTDKADNTPGTSFAILA